MQLKQRASEWTSSQDPRSNYKELTVGTGLLAVTTKNRQVTKGIKRP